MTDEFAPHQPANLFPSNQQPGEIQNQPTDALMGASMIDLSGDGVKDQLLAVQAPDVMHYEGYRASVYINVDGVFQPIVPDDDAFRHTAHMAVGDFICDGADDIAGVGFHNESQHLITRESTQLSLRPTLRHRMAPAAIFRWHVPHSG